MLIAFLTGQVTFHAFLSWILALLAVLTIHEFAHAYSAYRLGDDTAMRQGRVTLNPAAHFDPIGTTLILLGGFGWGRAVPVNVFRLRHPRSGIVWVSLWGPLSNLITAAIIVALLTRTPIGRSESLASLGLLFEYTLGLSLMLAFFNLIPITPLDGSKVLAGLLPLKQAQGYERFMMVWGLPLLLGLIFILPSFLHINLVRPWVEAGTWAFFRVLGLLGL